MSENNSGYTIIRISDYFEFLQQVTEIYAFINNDSENKNLIQEGNKEIWFRGVSNSKYPLIPSIYRPTLLAGEQNSTELINILCKLRDNFHVEAVNMIEAERLHSLYFDKKNIYSWLVMMEHYQTPTNLLNFSTKQNTALFFALQDYFYNKNFESDSIPCVWVLIPTELNKNCKKKIVANFESINNENYIPLVDDYKKSSKDSIFNYHCAIRSVYDNKNIKKQSGVFVNFPLNIKKSQIESYYLEGQDNSKEFLVKILISEPHKLVSQLWFTGERPWDYLPHLDIVGKTLGSNRFNSNRIKC